VLKSNVTYFYEGCYIISEERFRRRLTEYEKDNGDLQLRLSETETVMLTKDSEITTLRKKLKQLEKQNDTLQHANNVYQLEREQLEREVRKTDL
jgi:chromosome segregation ATPase